MEKVKSQDQLEHKIHDLEIKQRLEKRAVDKDVHKGLLYSGVALSLIGFFGLIISLFRRKAV